jgi:hypothetical protein
VRRVIRCASAVLRVRRPIESRFGAKQLVTIVGAGKGIRTLDLLITSELLYRLSYPGGVRESTEGVRCSTRGDAARAIRAGALRWD